MEGVFLCAVRVLEMVRERLDRSLQFSASSISSDLQAVSDHLAIPHRTTMQLSRAAIIGQPVRCHSEKPLPPS